MHTMHRGPGIQNGRDCLLPLGKCLKNYSLRYNVRLFSADIVYIVDDFPTLNQLFLNNAAKKGEEGLTQSSESL